MTTSPVSPHILQIPNTYGKPSGTEFLALSLRSEGYTVFANTEASGTFSKRLADDANRRMEHSGVILQGFFAIVMDLMRDWRNTPGSLQLLPFLDQYLPVYGYVARAHEAAVLNGTLLPGESGLNDVVAALAVQE